MEVVVRESRLGGVGLPPGELGIPLEVTSRHAAHIRVLGYGPDGCYEFETEKADEALNRIGEKPVTWVQVTGICQVGIIQEIGRRLNIHPLALEDVATTWGRSKLQDYGEQLFVVGKAAVLDAAAKRLSIEQVSMVVGANYVVSFQETESPLFDPVEERVLDPQRIIRKKGPGYLLYALLDTLVDHLLASIDAVEEEIIEMEDGVLDKQHSLDIQAIYRHKRAVLMLSRIASPMQELAKRIETLDSDLVPDSLDYFFRDLADHSTRAAERIAHARAVLQNLQEYYHIEGDHRNNDVMRVLTVIATIFIPMTFVVGVYGMNFNPAASHWNMPELNEPYGYPIVMVAMALYAVIMLVFFKRKKWM